MFVSAVIIPTRKSTSSNWIPYNSFSVSSENLMVHQNSIPLLDYFLYSHHASVFLKRNERLTNTLFFKIVQLCFIYLVLEMRWQLNKSYPSFPWTNSFRLPQLWMKILRCPILGILICSPATLIVKLRVFARNINDSLSFLLTMNITSNVIISKAK